MKHMVLVATFVVAMFWGVKGYAQEVLLATLQHGETTSVFYGYTALQAAMNAAQASDVITLSPGAFAATEINKAVRLQGAGYTTDVANGRYPTIIIGDIQIKLPEGAQGLIFDGILNSEHINILDKIVAATFRKCRFNIFNMANYESHSKDCLIDQCRIGGSLTPDRNSDNLSFKNCIINLLYQNQPSSILYIENCVITSWLVPSITAIFRNNILRINGSSLNSSCFAYNNVFITGNANGTVGSGNSNTDATTLFGKDISGYSDTETYELTPSAQSTYLGTDGKQVGIYGGLSPFTSIPTNPQITQKNIDAQSTADGKLKVSITVEAQK